MTVVVDVPYGKPPRNVFCRVAAKVGVRKVVSDGRTKGAVAVVQKHIQRPIHRHHQVRVSVPVQVHRYNRVWIGFSCK